MSIDDTSLSPQSACVALCNIIMAPSSMLSTFACNPLTLTPFLASHNTTTNHHTTCSSALSLLRYQPFPTPMITLYFPKVQLASSHTQVYGSFHVKTQLVTNTNNLFGPNHKDDKQTVYEKKSKPNSLTPCKIPQENHHLIKGSLLNNVTKRISVLSHCKRLVTYSARQTLTSSQQRVVL